MGRGKEQKKGANRSVAMKQRESRVVKKLGEAVPDGGTRLAGGRTTCSRGLGFSAFNSWVQEELLPISHLTYCNTARIRKSQSAAESLFHTTVIHMKVPSSIVFRLCYWWEREKLSQQQ